MGYSSLASTDGQQGILTTPVRVSTLSSRRKVRHLACGRKHYVLLTSQPFAPLCQVIPRRRPSLSEGESSSESFALIAGRRTAIFDIQAVDNNGDVCRSGGCRFVAKWTPLAIDFEIKARLQLSVLADSAPLSPVTVELEDNFNGLYTCECRMLVTGLYSLSVYLNELEVKDSPMELAVEAGDVCPSNCVVWWGRWAVPVEGGGKGNSQALRVEAGESAVFTVSCRDAFNNKCLSSEGLSVELEVTRLQRQGKGEGEREGQGDELDVLGAGSKSLWRDSSSGVFPCVLSCPSSAGEYEVLVRMAASSDPGSAKLHVRNSPFKLTVEDKKAQKGEEKEEATAITIDEGSSGIEILSFELSFDFENSFLSTA